jgi:hypothetical protein
MKKGLLLVIIISSIFAACKKSNDYVFKQSPDDRINAALASYQSTLAGATNGWKAFITVRGDSGGTYGFYFKFTNENRVNMFSDFDSTSAVTRQETSYRLKAEQQPTLIFDTYSYVHVLADPNEATPVIQANVNGGPVGQGLLSDFEFIIDSAKIKADTIELTGKVNHSKLLLVRATQAEEDAYNSGGLAIGLYLNKILTYFKRLTIGSQLYDIRIDPVNRQFIFSWLDATGNLITFTTGYYYIAGGIVFTTPFANGTQTISGFDNMRWNQATGTLNLTVGSSAATITGIVIPLKVDLGAPRRWWQYAVDNGNLYWISIFGFHVNGIDDAFGLTTLPRYYYLLYWPGYDTGNDLFAPVFIDSAGTGVELHYGAAPATPTFTADGRAVFVELGTYGPYPTTGPAVLTSDQLYNSSGYYFVETGATSYDMVSAADGKAWVSWFWVF